MLIRYALYDPKNKQYEMFSPQRKSLESFLQQTQQIGLSFKEKDGKYYQKWKQYRDKYARCIIKKFKCIEV